MAESPKTRVGLARTPRVSLIWKTSAISVLILLIGLVVLSIPKRRSFPSVSVEEVVRAVQKYTQAKSAAGEPVPEWISAKDLVRSGFLSEKIMDEYAPAELVVCTHSDPTKPQDVLAVAKWPDGQDVCLFGDGSVQQISPSAKGRRGLKYP